MKSSAKKTQILILLGHYLFHNNLNDAKHPTVVEHVWMNLDLTQWLRAQQCLRRHSEAAAEAQYKSDAVEVQVGAVGVYVNTIW